MVRYRDEDDRERISWREIDRRRDRSPHAPKEIPPSGERSRRTDWIKKHYRKEIDKLFMGKKGTKKHQKAHDEIERSYGTDQFETAVSHYIDEYGLPEDWNTLSLVLESSDSEKVLQALNAMRGLYESRSPVEKQGFKARVDILAMTAQNSDLRDAAEEILKTL